MNKRILAASLWLFAGWYVGTAIAVFLGLPEVVGLLPGIAMAAFVAADPMRRLWTPARASGIHS
jgi:Na+/H+ antiporter NhaC